MCNPTIDIRDDKGKSPLERAMDSDSFYQTDGCIDVCHFLINHGCSSTKETLTKLLYGACKWGKLDIVNDLVEQHKLDSDSESYYEPKVYEHCT